MRDKQNSIISLNKRDNRITFKFKTGHYLELLKSETRKLFGKNKTTKDETGENSPHLEITKVVLVQCNILNDNYQHDSRVLHIFVPNKSFGQLLLIKILNR